jgi:hypothetical protein
LAATCAGPGRDRDWQARVVPAPPRRPAADPSRGHVRRTSRGCGGWGSPRPMSSHGHGPTDALALSRRPGPRSVLRASHEDLRRPGPPGRSPAGSAASAGDPQWRQSYGLSRPGWAGPGRGPGRRGTRAIKSSAPGGGAGRCKNIGPGGAGSANITIFCTIKRGSLSLAAVPVLARPQVTVDSGPGPPGRRDLDGDTGRARYKRASGTSVHQVQACIRGHEGLQVGGTGRGVLTWPTSAAPANPGLSALAESGDSDV